MRILMLTWEYPPQVVGGLGRAVADLSETIALQGHDVRVITNGYPGCEPEEMREGVKVYRTNMFHPQPLNFLDSVLYLNFNLIQRANQLFLEGWEWDILHVHDWLVAHAGSVLKHSTRCPLLATIHATEWGRNNGIHNDLQRHISDIEWWLAYEAYHVICCSDYMLEEIKQVYQVPSDKISVIPNGVYPENFKKCHDDLKNFKRSYALEDEDIVFFVGRLVHEKGVDTLLESVPLVLSEHPAAKFIVAGKGPALDYLRYKSWEMGVGHKVLFPGFIDDLSRNSLYRLAKVAVFPSLYEPFGIVALEAMAAQAPLVVSDVGGLREIVRHGVNGLTFYAGNSRSLADNILAMLKAPKFARELASKAYFEVHEKYSWEAIGKQTLKICSELMERNADYVAQTSRIPKDLPHLQAIERYQETANGIR